jgi:hypothetical protein
MINRNGPNERVKRRYLQFLKDVKGRDEASLDAVAEAVDRFEKTRNVVTSRSFMSSRRALSRRI